MTVHNHGPAEGPGLGCPERRTEIGGYLRGACLPDPVDPEPYCDHGPFDACRCLVPTPPADAEDMHVYAHEFDPIGGFVCAVCGTPTESEPCRDHQPNAYAKIT